MVSTKRMGRGLKPKFYLEESYQLIHSCMVPWSWFCFCSVGRAQDKHTPKSCWVTILLAPGSSSLHSTRDFRKVLLSNSASFLTIVGHPFVHVRAIKRHWYYIGLPFQKETDQLTLSTSNLGFSAFVFQVKQVLTKDLHLPPKSSNALSFRSLAN